MTKGFYNLTSGILSQSRRLDTVANNMTNLSTSGYKAEQYTDSTFQEAVSYTHLDRLHRQEGIDIVDVLEVIGFAGRLKLRGGCRLRGGLFLQCLLLSELPVAQEAANTQAAAHQQERRRGSAGHQPQQR